MKFVDLSLAEPILRAIAAEGYEEATAVQAQAIPHVLAGRDVLGCAQTGTGKTAAFALPILHRLVTDPTMASTVQAEPDPAAATPARPFKHIRPGNNGKKAVRARCLVLSPTRELATQIANSFKTYGQFVGVKGALIYGGVHQSSQVKALHRGCDVIVATPGRLLDLVEQGHADLRAVRTLVLDEADRMLDMGFIHDILRIVGELHARDQTLLFSATLSEDIRRLGKDLLKDPVTVRIASAAPTADKVDQSVYHVEQRNKPALLAHLVDSLPIARAIVFTRTKHGADRLVKVLQEHGIRSDAIHGNKSQNARQRALENFRSAKVPLLVATDVASRGIDVDGVTHVVNFDLTHEPETYIHRIGRTARAGASGSALSFCDHGERGHLKAIERLLRKAIPVAQDHPHQVAEPRRAEPRQQGQGQRAHAEQRPRANPPAHPHNHGPAYGRPTASASAEGQGPAAGGRPRLARAARPTGASRKPGRGASR